MVIDYYRQDLVNGGYKKEESYETPLFHCPRDRIEHELRDQGVWGGMQVIETTDSAHFAVWINRYFVPKLAPLVMLDDHGKMIVGGHQVGKWFNWQLSAISAATKIIIGEAWDNYRDFATNRDKEGYPKDPVPRNKKREEWVERLMYKLKMKRSNYQPTFAERFPYVNVGTVGHVDWSVLLGLPGSRIVRRMPI